MKILSSHEVPICLLKDSMLFNDFDYALVHLFETKPEYYDFYERSVFEGREVLLDNSIFELGEAVCADVMKKWVEKLRPACYIVPDCLENTAVTIDNCENWMSNQGASGHAATARKIGVVQGKTLSELIKCYQYMCNTVDQIAISFDYSYYKIAGYGKTALEQNMSGRQILIRTLIQEGIWNWRKPVHLLGCSLAREFRWYVQANIWNIRSCDTSNPVVAGIEGHRYDSELGLKTKSSRKLVEYMDIALTSRQKEMIKDNVGHFKSQLQ